MIMNVLVTGCAGFIGQATAKKLLNDGHKVIGIDNMNDSYSPALKEYRLGQLARLSGFRFFPHNIESKETFDIIYDSNDIDVIIHMAARAGVRTSVENPFAYYQTNMMGTMNILEVIKDKPCKLIMASTSSVYEGSTMPYNEQKVGGVLLSPYASSKRAAEDICGVYHKLYGIDVTVLRFFTVYGPMGRPDMAPWIFTDKILNNEPVTIYGDGEQSRDFTYIDDIVDGIIKAIPIKGYEIINLGSDNPHSVNELISLIEIYSGERVIKKYKPRNISDMESTHADITKAKSMLKWHPKTSLEEGVLNLSTWFINEWKRYKEAA